MLHLKNNFEQLLHQIKHNAVLANTQTRVSLVAISKTVAIEPIQQLYQYGQRDFGESYVDEMLTKIIHLKHLSINWHFIGNLQSNKIKLIANKVSWVDSIEKISQVELLARYRKLELPSLNCLIQVNPSGAVSQHGIDINNLEQIICLAKAINQTPNLRLRGIMAIAANSAIPEVVNRDFIKLRQLFDSLKATFSSIDSLSMGMSGDFEAAILHGATMVRIGTKLFGSRRG